MSRSALAARSARRLLALILLPAGAAVVQPVRAQTAPLPPLPEIELHVAGHGLQAEVARTRRQRETGLMFRRELARDHGMLFVFTHDQPVCMWMKNTYVPLSVAFVEADGTIRNIDDMQPLTLDAHCAGAPVRYALEMPLGWFARHAAGPGSPVQGLPTARPR